jgi:hypothetical protein
LGRPLLRGVLPEYVGDAMIDQHNSGIIRVKLLAIVVVVQAVLSPASVTFHCGVCTEGIPLDSGHRFDGVGSRALAAKVPAHAGESLDSDYPTNF